MKANRIRLAALLAACLMLLAACSAGAVDLKYQNGAYRNEKKDMAFRVAPICYRAVSMQSNERVATVVGLKSGDIPLYAIKDMDSALWLSDDTYTLYYSDKTSLPSLTALDPTYVVLSYSSNAYEIGRIENAAEIDDLVDIFTNDQATTVPAAKVIPSPETRYEIVFFSEAYPGIAYSLEYWKFSAEVELYAQLTADGKVPNTYPGIRATIEEVSGETVAVFHLGSGLVFDRSEDRFYAIGDVLESYFTEG